MRVFAFVSSPPAAWGSNVAVNGPEKRWVGQVASLTKAGVICTVFYPKDGRLRGHFRDCAVIDFRAQGIAGLRHWFGALVLAMRCRPDIIHCQGPSSYDFFTVFVGLLARVPVVVTRAAPASDFAGSGMKRLISITFDAVSQSMCDLMVYVSEETRIRCQLRSPTPPREEVITNGVAIRSRLPRASQSRIPVICMVGQIKSGKGFSDFVEVVALVHNQLPVRAVIVGDGPQRHDIELLVKMRRLEGVIQIVGYTNDVSSHLESSDLFLFTSHHEGMAVSVLEAMESALPVVASDVGAIRSQLAERDWNDCIFQRGDVQAAAQKVIRILREPRKALALGERNRMRVVKHFSEARMHDQYLKVYQRLTERNALPAL